VETDPVILALRAAVAAADSPELRAALADRYLKMGAPREALAEADEGLRRFPASPSLLAAAVGAARAAGDASRASAYELARAALAGSVAEPRHGGSASEGGPETYHGGAGLPPPSTAPGSRLRLVTADEVAAEAPPPLTFADVAGLDALKARLDRGFLSPLRDPALHARFGKKVGGGLLLYGAPGCGKTFVARALAGELSARFVSIGLTDVMSLWLGESERRLHELFELARRQRPTLLFFDEVDAIGQRRSHLKGAAGRNLVNQLLAEMDGVEGANEGLFFLAATNHPWDVDPALRRPGRFDRLVFVPPPDVAARLRILQLALAGRPLAGGTDLAPLARTTAEHSGADLKAIVEEATELAIDATRRIGADQPIDAALLSRAAKDVRPSTRAWFELARNHALYANEGGAYDDLVEHLRAMRLA
jgi:AAA+ superfamily predicted ATPase